jgi:hypothetical protein
MHGGGGHAWQRNGANGCKGGRQINNNHTTHNHHKRGVGNSAANGTFISFFLSLVNDTWALYAYNLFIKPRLCNYEGERAQGRRETRSQFVTKLNTRTAMR